MRIAVADIEADGLLDSATRVWCLAFKDITTGDTISFGPEEVKEGIDYMDSLDVCIMHNGIGYDWPLLEKLYGYQYKGSKVDTLVMSRLLDPKRTIPPNCPNRRVGPHSIEAWGWRVGRGKPEHNDWTQFSEEMLHRCREDVEIQHLVYEALMKEAKGGNWRNAFLMSFKLFEVLQKQEQYGWKVDRKYMEECIRTLDRWIDRIDRALEPHLPLLVEVQEQKVKGEYKFVSKPFLKSGKYSRSVDNWYLTSGCCRDSHPVGGPFSRVSFRKLDLGSSNEVKAFLLSEGWEPAAWNYNSEGQRTSPILDKDDPFDGVQGGVGRLIVKRVQCRQRKSIIEGLIGIIRPDGRIASIVNNLAVTGRATHRGIVNIPKPGSFFGKQMRKMFICSEGKVLVGTDSDSCQLRMLGGRMGSEEYIQALVSGDKEKGTDLHSLTKKVGDIETRDLAKNVIYCLLFGGGDDKLGRTAKKPGQGKQLRDKLYRGFDGLGELVDNLTKEWRATAKRRFNPKFNRMEWYDGAITGLDGRPIKVPYEHQLLVYLLQSDEAIMMSAAYIKIDSDLQKRGYKWGEDYGIVCFYHDEVNIECRKEIASEVAAISEEAIAWAGRFFKIKCPHIGDSAIGKSWYEVH